MSIPNTIIFHFLFHPINITSSNVVGGKIVIKTDQNKILLLIELDYLGYYQCWEILHYPRVIPFLNMPDITGTVTMISCKIKIHSAMILQTNVWANFLYLIR